MNKYIKLNDDETNVQAKPSANPAKTCPNVCLRSSTRAVPTRPAIRNPAINPQKGLML